MRDETVDWDLLDEVKAGKDFQPYIFGFIPFEKSPSGHSMGIKMYL